MQINPFTSGKRNLKPLLKVSISLSALVVLFTAALAYSKGTEKRILFKGYLQGRETDVPHGNPPEALSVDGNVTGLATHLGQFTLTYKVAVQLPDGSATGSAELIAADKVLYSFRLSGRANPPIVTHRI